MKTLLAILLSFIVSEAPVLAIHGGYTLGGAAGVIGTYAGVMIPTKDTVLNTETVTASGTTASIADFGENALGLFSLSIPATGFGSGVVYIFSSDQELQGSIQALTDPTNPSGILGVIHATGQVNVFTETGNEGIFGTFNANQTQITGDADGELTAIVANAAVSASPNGVNLSGTASLTVSSAVTGTNGLVTFVPTDSIVFAVDGFQQSSVPTSTSGT